MYFYNFFNKTTPKIDPSRLSNPSVVRTIPSLKDNLSQIWLNQCTLLLLLMCVKLYLFQKSLDSSLTTLSLYSNQTCQQIQTYASKVASAPNQVTTLANGFLSQMLNELSESRIMAIRLLITVIENLLVFMLEMVLGTFICILTATVEGTADISLNATQSAIHLVNQTVISLAGDVQDGLDGIAEVVNTLISGFDAVEDFFTGDINQNGSHYIHQVNLTIEALRNIKLPSSIIDDINSLRNDLPDFEDVTNYTTSLIKAPFELLKEEIDITNVSSRELIAVPQTKQLSVCSSSVIDKFYMDLASSIRATGRIIAIVLLVLAIVAIIPLGVNEWYRWRKLKLMVKTINSSEDESQILQILYEYDNKVVFYIANKMGWMVSNEKGRSYLIWFISYICSSRVIRFLYIGLAGLITVFLQYMILRIVASSKTNMISLFQDITAAISKDMGSSLSNWTATTNQYLVDEQAILNQGLFGWIDQSATSVNDTTVEIVDRINSTMYDTFYNTLLFAPLNTIVYCVFERKLLKVEEAMTWITYQFDIKLPQIDNDMFQGWSNAHDLQEVYDDNLTGIETVIDSIIGTYRDSLRFELYISVAIISVWLIVLLLGLLIISVRIFTKNVDIVISLPMPITSNETDSRETISELNEKDVYSSSSIFSTNLAPPIIQSAYYGNQEESPFHDRYATSPLSVSNILTPYYFKEEK